MGGSGTSSDEGSLPVCPAWEPSEASACVLLGTKLWLRPSDSATAGLAVVRRAGRDVSLSLKLDQAGSAPKPSGQKKASGLS